MLIECVPNFSEGRKAETIERIEHSIASVRGALVLGRHMDVDHNRSVITFVGATDVLPFVPVSGVTMDECIGIAHETGRRIWQELSIPVFFYERAARRTD